MNQMDDVLGSNLRYVLNITKNASDFFSSTFYKPDVKRDHVPLFSLSLSLYLEKFPLTFH